MESRVHVEAVADQLLLPELKTSAATLLESQPQTRQNPNWQSQVHEAEQA